MAVAFRSVSARTKVDTSVSGATQSIALPTGHASGDLLLLFVVTDDNTGPTATPAGWNLLGARSAGASTQTPYYGSAHTWVYWRLDTGALGSAVSLTFSTAGWPAGSPYVLAWTAAYTGADPAAPIGPFAFNATGSSNAVNTHPQVSTGRAGTWLLTFRAIGSDNPRTFTIAPADTERVDDAIALPAAPSAAMWDTNAAVSVGPQTQRVTTASGTVGYGSVVWALTVQPPSAAGTTTASARSAAAEASAFNATVATADGPWDLCDDDERPAYRVAIDWDGMPGPLNPNYDFEDEGGWSVVIGPATFARSQTRAHRGAWSGLMTTGAGSGNRFDGVRVPVTAGRVYRASGWAWAESAMPSGLSFSVNWYDAPVGGAYLSTSFQVFVPDTGFWTYSEGFFTAPAGAAGAVITASASGTPGAGLRVWTDEVRLDDWSAMADPSSVVGEGEDVTGDIVSEITFNYGRDQERQLAQASVGSAAFTLTNAERTYSPENALSPFYGDLDPARVMTARAVWGGQVWPLFRGRIDEYTVKTDFGDRTVDLTFLDGLNDLSGVDLSTEVHAGLRTGDLMHVILDAAGWTGSRDIDPGATVVPYWWADGTDAFAAINDLVKSEGPPAIAYVHPSGTFVFRDRHHRLRLTPSRVSQATLHAGALGECTGQGVPEGALSLARPFTYAHGWRDIVNSVTFDVPVRVPAAEQTAVWSDTSTYTLALGQALDLTVSSSDAFVDAVVPVPGTDIVYTGAGVVQALLSRDSGASARLTLTAVGGPVTITSVQVRGRLVSAEQTVRVSAQDPGSVSRHGERAYGTDAPWAGPEDARAIAATVLLHYAQRRPTVQLRLVSSDPAHYAQVLQRTVSDRIRVVNDEMGLDDDFFVEKVAHTIQRVGREGKPPVHAVVLSCEKDMVATINPFTFDLRGAGFDEGQFDRPGADDPSAVFVFDDPVQGRFDTGVFGT